MILEFTAGYIGAHALDDAMAESRNLDGGLLPGRGTTARTEGIGRTLAPPDRQPTFEPMLEPRSIGAPRPSIFRDGGRPLFVPPPPGSAPPPPPGSSSAPTDGETIGVGSYGDDYGLPGVLADLFLRTFGADETDTPQPPIVVGDAGFAGSNAGSSGTVIIVLILAGVAGAAYYFFFRKKGGEG